MSILLCISQLFPVDEGEHSLTRSDSYLRSNPSIEDLAQRFDSLGMDTENSTEERRDSEEKDSSPKPSQIQRFGEKLTNLEIPKNNDLILTFESKNPDIDSPTDCYGMVEDAIGSGIGRNQAENILEEPVLQMNSNNLSQEYKSSQVGKQLSGKWTTGAGPRIRYVRDYPPELQVQALEQVNLSPRSSGLLRSHFSPRSSSGLSLAMLT